MHQSVLLQEVVEGLKLIAGLTVVDATVNGGGHARAIAEKGFSDMTLVCIDADRDALTRARARLADVGTRVSTRTLFIHGNFRDLRTLLAAERIDRIDRVLFDLGLSSDQLEASGRGFSFQKDEPLLMTFSETPGSLTAADIVNSWPTAELIRIFRDLGEEFRARGIAQAIEIARRKRRILTSHELADLVVEATGGRRGKIHPATKVFQALRMTVNDELGAIEHGLSDAYSLLSSGGRLAVISFHSVEDRLVKRLCKGFVHSGGRLLDKHVIKPSREECLRNPRARSAKLRIVEKTAQSE